MAKKDKNVAPGSFPDKWHKMIISMPEFKDTADASSVEDLKKIIIASEGNIYTIEQEKEENTQIKAAKETLSEMLAPFREAMKVQMAKIKYALYLLESKGVEIDQREEE